MNEASQTCQRTTSGDTTSATSSQASGAGPTPCASPESRTSSAGQAPAHASPSAQQGAEKETRTSGTSGQFGKGSSRSIGLSEFLGSKLKRLLSTTGSTLFRQTWKPKATPSGRLYWVHTVSVPRT